MSVDDVEKYEAEAELALYREYRDVLPMFHYVVETDRRLYLANEVKVTEHAEGGDTWFEVLLTDAWVWDTYRASRFVAEVRVTTFHDFSVEERRPDEEAGPPAELGR